MIRTGEKNKDGFSEWGKLIKTHRLPRWNELPDIDLYMDQLISLLIKYLGVYFENLSGRAVTPNMINNYVKLGIIPSPLGKKYTRAHIAQLIMICVLKQVISIASIQLIITEGTSQTDISVFYDSFCDIQDSMNDSATDELAEFECSNETESLALRMAAKANSCKMISEKAVSLFGEKDI